MTTQRALAALVVIVGVVAIGAAAAGVDDASPRSGVSEDVGQGPGDGPGASGDGDQRGAEPGDSLEVPAWTLEWYLILATTGFTLLGLIGAIYLVWRDGLDGLLALVNTTVSTLVGLAIGVVIFVALLWLGFDWSNPRVPPPGQPPEPGGGGADPLPQSETGVPPLLLVGVLAVLVALAVLFVRRRRAAGDDESDEARESVESEEPPAESLNVPTPPSDGGDERPDNAVYRAWHDLAASVGLAHERTRTPGEVAEAAIDQGLPRDAVGTLTTVFGEVRYGHRPVTDERAERARSALEVIERTGGET